MSITDKACTNCHTRKDLTMFYANKKLKDGLETSCKECRKGKTRARYIGKPKRTPWRKQRSF